MKKSKKSSQVTYKTIQEAAADNLPVKPKKMNPRIKQLWIDALRSDDYEQNFDPDGSGFIQLRTKNNKWNPFGVLCNLHAMEHSDDCYEELDPEEYLGYMFLLPKEVSIWAGLENTWKMNFSSPFDWYGEKMYNIEDMYNSGIPFFVIADVIEVKF